MQELNLDGNQLRGLPAKVGQLGRLQKLYLWKNQLRELPRELWSLSDLQVLSLGENELKELPAEIGKLTSLQELYLQRNQLRELPRELWSLSDLQVLYLWENGLKELPRGIGQLKSLQKLYLGKNELRELPGELWSLNNLQDLSLWGNQLRELPGAIGKLRSLQRLNFQKNELKELPRDLWSLSSLQELNLSENELKESPEEIGKLRNLQKLYLQKNGLREVPSELWLLTGLQILNLNENQLSLLPAEIGQLGSLQELGLWENQLKELPGEIGKLRSLQKLHLRKNQLREVPRELGLLSNLQELSVGENELKELPGEIGKLKSLQKLYLQKNQLRKLPGEIGKLSNLQELGLWENQLEELPAEIGQLTGLQKLYLWKNRLREVPPELWSLSSLQELWLSENELKELPGEIGRLRSLQKLHLWKNQLREVPPELWSLSNLQELYLGENELKELPGEIGKLRSLQDLNLNENELKELPGEIGKLRRLQKLYLRKNQLREVPPELWSLSNLQELSLGENELKELPAEIGQLERLRKLYLQKNQLREVPAELWNLTVLQILKLNENQLSLLPAEICQLSGLQELYLGGNRLDQLPPEMGRLTNLQKLNVDDMPTLLTPPPEIVARGTGDMLAFLRDLQKGGEPCYEAKLLLVGEGGTGKSSLSRALRNKAFDPHLPTTHGIEVDHLKLLDSKITLNIWDFGGQHIYHSTHQFFFTKRSLYVVVWSARLGAEQGRLSYWLDTIKSLAPDAPIILVATYADEREPDLNYQFYKARYPQLVGNLSVSNEQGTGLMELKEVLLDKALQLPHVSQPWPKNWLDLKNALLSLPGYYIDYGEYTLRCSACGVETDIANGTLGNYLHDLGKILYFQDDDILSNLVVLKPNWVTKAISRVLDDEGVSRAKGILYHSEFLRIWGAEKDGLTYGRHLYQPFLHLMERYELSYRIEAELPGGSSTSSLVPLLLPYEPPASLPAWPRRPPVGHSQAEMVYHLDSVPAGIMSRFIVRTQLYTKNLHWRDGVMLEYQGHQARVELDSEKRMLHLLVQGLLPQNFFTILMNTVDEILARFEGLTIRREIPCTCHWERDGDESCPYTYRYETLVRRMQAGKPTIECLESYADIPVLLLLYGIHSSTDRQMIADIRQSKQGILEILNRLPKLGSGWEENTISASYYSSKYNIRNSGSVQSQVVGDNPIVNNMYFNIDQSEFESLPQRFSRGNAHSQVNRSLKLDDALKELDQKSEWIARDFLRRCNQEMQKLEAECPATFVLTSGGDSAGNPRSGVSQEYQMHLVCQHPSGPHEIDRSYSVCKDTEWWRNVRPWINHLVEFLKYGLPSGEAVGVVYDAVDVKPLEDSISLMEEIVNDVSEFADESSLKSLDTLPEGQQAVGAALRAIYNFLKEADPEKIWGGLKKMPTPDGNILWLCETHRKQYEVKPLS